MRSATRSAEPGSGLSPRYGQGGGAPGLSRQKFWKSGSLGVAPPVVGVPPVPAPAPPVVEAAGGGGGATAAGGCTTAGGAAAPCGIVEVATVDVVAVVSAGGSSVVAVGIVRSGDVRGMSLDSSSSAPHALNPPASTMVASSAAQREAMRRDPASGDRVHAPVAVRAVVEVALRELVAPVAEAQALDRPRQARLRRRER